LRIGRKIDEFVEQNGLGATFGAETGFILARDPDVLLGPDAAFVLAERLPPLSDQSGYLALAPDLAVEIVSPSDRWTMVTRKVDRYLLAGVRLVWVVDQASRSVTVCSADGPWRTLHIETGDALDGGAVLPGFRLPLADLFLQR
jgi:Uma2 family endonuclease